LQRLYGDGRPKICEIQSWERNFGLGRGSDARFVLKKVNLGRDKRSDFTVLLGIILHTKPLQTTVYGREDYVDHL